MIEYADMAAKWAPVALVGGAGWWFRKWVKGVDDRIRGLEQQHLAATTQNAMSQGEQKQMQGQFQQIQIAHDTLSDRVSHNRGNISAIWRVLEHDQNRTLEKRLSDQGK